MCDYSLCGIPNRLAVEGEELVVHRFSTGSLGLASPADLENIRKKVQPGPPRTFWARVKRFFDGDPPAPSAPAVCIPPGAHLILHEIPLNLRHLWNIQATEGVKFTQLSATPNAYRDAIQFVDGRQVRLQELPEGLRATVLSLAGTTATAERYAFAEF